MPNDFCLDARYTITQMDDAPFYFKYLGCVLYKFYQAMFFWATQVVVLADSFFFLTATYHPLRFHSS